VKTPAKLTVAIITLVVLTIGLTLAYAYSPRDVTTNSPYFTATQRWEFKLGPNRLPRIVRAYQLTNVSDNEISVEINPDLVYFNASFGRTPNLKRYRIKHTTGTREVTTFEFKSGEHISFYSVNGAPPPPLHFAISGVKPIHDGQLKLGR